jgi:DNA primase catalytic core
MSKLSDWIEYKLYPALFERIDTVFPEHNFTRSRSGWISNTYLNGSPHKRRDKTKVNTGAPYYIFEQGGDGKNIIQYIADRDGIERIEAIKHLAEIAGLRLPKDPNYDPEKYRRAERRRGLLEEANSYFMHLLTEHKTGGKERDAVLQYLTEKRGYDLDTIKAMELGYCPNQKRLFKELERRRYTQEEIKETLKISHDTRIGGSHRIAIPYRSGGRIKGFKFRRHDDASPKYLNTKDLDKSSAFFNISAVGGRKDVVIVEGELDALHATAKGVEENIVATAGNSINEKQIQDAVRRGAESFTVCLDYEKGKEDDTVKKIIRITEIIRSTGVDRVYIAQLPDIGQDKTDPDSLIQAQGVDALKEAISNRHTYGQYKANQIIKKLTEKAKDGLDVKDRDLVRDEIAKTRAELNGQDRIDFNALCLSKTTEKLGITEDIINELEESQKQALQEAKRNAQIKDLLRKVNATEETGVALDKLREGIKKIDTATGAGLLPEGKTFSNLLQEIAEIQPGLKTGYEKLDSFIRIAPAAMTLIAGRTSHGKTTFMFNLMLNMSQANLNKRFYFFTFEEPTRNIIVKLLNREIRRDLNRYYHTATEEVHTNYEFLKDYIRTGRDDIKEIEHGKHRLQELIDSERITIIDKNYTVEELYSAISYLNSKYPIGAVFIDYIQRMRTERRTQDKRTEIAHISDIVLQTAKDTGLPIILGAQLNRGATNETGDKRPRLEHLKEAGNLEEDANLVLSVYQEAREKEQDDTGSEFTDPVELEIRALKNREGATNKTATLSFDRRIGKIKNEDTPF